jgi:hypothetical protein
MKFPAAFVWLPIRLHIYRNHCVFCVGLAASCIGLANTVHAENVAPMRADIVGPSASLQLLSVDSAASPRTAESEKSAPGRTRKIIMPIFAPILGGIGELRHPVALLKSATSYIWPMSRLRWSESAGEKLLSEATSDPDPLDVTFSVVRSFRLSSPVGYSASGPFSGRHEDAPSTLAHGRPLPLTRNSAAQLNLRVSSELSFLAEVDRSEAVVGDSEVGVGVGFKVAF